MIPGSELIIALREYLNIPYKDEATDRVLISALERGQSIIDNYAGTEQDYSQEGLARQLLLDYCRYVRSHAAEVFEINFRKDLINLRELAEIQAVVQAETEAESG